MAPAKSKKKAPAPAKKAPPKKSTKKPAAAAKAPPPAKKAPPPKKAAKKAPAKAAKKAPVPTGPRACATYEGPVEGCVFTTVRGITGYFEDEHPAATEPAPAKAAKKARAPKRKAPAPKKAKKPPAPAGALGKIVGHAGAAIADFLEFGDVRSSLCAGGDFVELHEEVSTFDIGLAASRAFKSSERPAFDVCIRGVLSRMPRLKSLVLSHQLHVSAATFEGVDLGRVEHLGLRNCFRLTAPDLSSIVARSPRVTSLDLTQIALAPAGIEAILQSAPPSLRTLRLHFVQLAERTGEEGIFKGQCVRNFGGISRLELHNTPGTYPALAKFRDPGMKVEARCYRMHQELAMMKSVKKNVLPLVGSGLQLAFHAHTEQWICAGVDARIVELGSLIAEINVEIDALPPCPEDEFLDEFYGHIYGDLSAVESRAGANVFRVERYLQAREESRIFRGAFAS